MTSADDHNLSYDNHNDRLLNSVIRRLLDFIDLPVQKENVASMRSSVAETDDNAFFLKQRVQDDNFVSEELFWADLIMFYQAMRRSAPDLNSQEEEGFSGQTDDLDATLVDMPDPDSSEEIGSFIDYDWDDFNREDQARWMKRLDVESSKDSAFAVPFAKVTLAYASDAVSLRQEINAYERARNALEELLNQLESDDGISDWEAQSLLVEIEFREIGAYVRRSLSPPPDVVKRSLDVIDRRLEASLEGDNALARARRSYANGRATMLWGFESQAHAEFEESRRLLRRLCDQDATDEINFLRLAYVNMALANIQLAVGDHDAAISSCKEAMEAFKNERVDYVCLIDLANCALQISEIRINEGDKRRAEESLWAALEFIEKLYKKNPSAYALNYAYVLLNCTTIFPRLGDNEKSLNVANRTVEVVEEILRNRDIQTPSWIKYDLARYVFQKRAVIFQNMKRYDATLYDLEKAFVNLSEKFCDVYNADAKRSEVCAAAIPLAIPVCEVAIALDRGLETDVVAQQLCQLVDNLRDDEIAKLARPYFVFLMILYSYNESCNREKKALEYLERAVSFSQRNGGDVSKEERGEMLVTNCRALHMRARHFFHHANPRALADVEAMEALVNEIHENGVSTADLEYERFDNFLIGACLFSERGRVKDARQAILRAVLLLNDQFAQKRWNNLPSLTRVVALSLLWLETYSSRQETLRVVKIWLRYINRLRIKFIELWYNLHDEGEGDEGDVDREFDLKVSILDDVTVTLRILRVRLLLKGRWSEELRKRLPIQGAVAAEIQNPFVKSRFQSLGDESLAVLDHMTLGEFFKKRTAFIRSLEEKNIASDETVSENESLRTLGGALAEVVWRDLNFCLRVFIDRARPKGSGNFGALFDTLQKIVEIYWAHNEKTLAVAEISVVASAFVPILIESNPDLQPYCERGARIDAEALKNLFRQMNNSFIAEARSLKESDDDADEKQFWTSRLVAARNVFCYLGDLLSAGEKNSWRISTFVDKTDDALSDRELQCFIKREPNENVFSPDEIEPIFEEFSDESNNRNEIDQFNAFLFQEIKIARPGERREFFERAERSYLLALCALGARVREKAALLPQYIESVLSYSTFLAHKGRFKESAELWASTESWIVPLLEGSKDRSLELLLFFYHHYFDFVKDALKDRVVLEKIAETMLNLLALDKPIDGERRLSLENHVAFLLDFAFMYNTHDDSTHELLCLTRASEILLEFCDKSLEFQHIETLFSTLQYIIGKGGTEERLRVARIFRRAERFFERLSPSERSAIAPTFWELSTEAISCYCEDKPCFFLANHFAEKIKSLSKEVFDAYLSDWDLGRIAVMTLPRLEIINKFYESFNDFADAFAVNVRIESVVLRVLNSIDSGEEYVSPTEQTQLLSVCGALIARYAYFAMSSSTTSSRESALELFYQLLQRLPDRVRNAIHWIRTIADVHRKTPLWFDAFLLRSRDYFRNGSYSFKEYNTDVALEFSVISNFVLVCSQSFFTSQNLNHCEAVSALKRLLAASREIFRFPNDLELVLIYVLADHSYKAGRWNDVIRAGRLFERLMKRSASLRDYGEFSESLENCRSLMYLLSANALVNRNGSRDLDNAQRCLDVARVFLNERLEHKKYHVRPLLWLEFLGLAKLAYKLGRVDEAKSYALRARHMEEWCRRYCRPFSPFRTYSDELDALIVAIKNDSNRSNLSNRNGENE